MRIDSNFSFKLICGDWLIDGAGGRSPPPDPIWPFLPFQFIFSISEYYWRYLLLTSAVVVAAGTGCALKCGKLMDCLPANGSTRRGTVGIQLTLFHSLSLSFSDFFLLLIYLKIHLESNHNLTCLFLSSAFFIYWGGNELKLTVGVCPSFIAINTGEPVPIDTGRPVIFSNASIDIFK